MRIGEIAEKTGLSISNIRFYEKKGLIGPEREQESKYRNYTEADLERLKRIILFRKMDLPVEVIGKILEGEVSAKEALEQQLAELMIKQQALQSTIDLCSKVVSDRAFAEIDTEYYLNYVKEEEANGKVFQKIDDFLDDFSDFTNFDLLAGRNIFWWLLPGTWQNRVVMACWCLLLMACPVIAIAEDLIEKNGIHPVKLTFWILWILFLGYAFVSFRKAKKERGCL